MNAWATWLSQARDAGILCPAPTPAELEQWPCDLSDRMAAALAAGWPQSPMQFVGTIAFGDPAALVRDLGTDWPPHLLPLGRRGSEALGWDARLDRVMVLSFGQLRCEHASLEEWLTLVAAWQKLAGRAASTQVGGWTAVDSKTWLRLVQGLPPAHLQSWTLTATGGAEQVAERLSQERRQALGTARWAGFVVALAPLGGWWLGAVQQPPQPQLGAGLAALVVGGAPSLLMGQAMLRARQLKIQLRQVQELDRLGRRDGASDSSRAEGE